MRRFSFLLLVLFCAIGVFAQHRSEEEAIEIAQQFFAKKARSKSPKLSVVSQQKVSQSIRRRVAANSAATNSSCYIINDEVNNRFVIVSADERIQKILGYSDEGKLEENSLPDVLIGMIAEYDRQYDFLLNNTNKIRALSPLKSEKGAISPLLRTMWNSTQTPYISKCPIITSENKNDTCDAGIGATAMAQIMKFYKHPKAGVGKITYKTKKTSITINHDFSADIFDWDNMLNDYYRVESTQEENDAVGNLMYSCGVSIGTDYGINGATSEFYDVPYALINIFQYNPNLVAYERNYFDDKEWYNIIDDELDAMRPIFYSAWKSNKTTYLRFVIDGRDENGLYHINWGQLHNEKRTFNGYYSLDVLREIVWEDGTIYMEMPEEDAFSYNHAMICKISPSLIGTHEDVFYTKEFTVKGKTVPLNSTIDYTLPSVTCYSTRSALTTFSKYFSAEIGIGLFDTNFNFIKSISDAVFTNDFTTGKSNYLSQSAALKIFTPTFEEGKQYYIAPYALIEGETVPARIRTLHGEHDYYLATVKDGVVEFTLKGEASKEPNAINVVQEFDVETQWHDGTLYLQSSKAGVINIHSIDGAVVKSIHATSNEAYPVDLLRGIYIINNKKIAVQ